jgi:glycosidase
LLRKQESIHNFEVRNTNLDDSYTNDMALAKNAATFTIMADGIPIIYAGQEQHYSGGSDPNNREATWLSKYNTDSELYKLIGRVNAIRNQAIYKSDTYTSYKVWIKCALFSFDWDKLTRYPS